MTEELARKKLAELVERTGRIPDAELDEFWASLPPARIEDLIGEWRGGEFDTGHKMNGLLDTVGWFGKTFHSAHDVKPLICHAPDGTKFSNVELGKGEASLWLEEFRGEVVATMVYDGQPTHDHFKRIDDDAVLGIMNGKGVLDERGGTARYFYFYLERV